MKEKLVGFPGVLGLVLILIAVTPSQTAFSWSSGGGGCAGMGSCNGDFGNATKCSGSCSGYDSNGHTCSCPDKVEGECPACS